MSEPATGTNSLHILTHLYQLGIPLLVSKILTKMTGDMYEQNQQDLELALLVDVNFKVAGAK